MRVLFTPGERDLAIAFAELEGFHVVDAIGCAKRPALVPYGESTPKRLRSFGAEPEQVAPGVFAYRVSRRSRRSS